MKENYFFTYAFVFLFFIHVKGLQAVTTYSKAVPSQGKPILLWTQLNLHSTNNESFVPYGFPYENAIMNLSLELKSNITEKRTQETKTCTILFKRYQVEQVYSSQKMELLLPCGSSYSIQAFCSGQLYSNVIRIFIPCPLNGNYVLSYRSGTEESNCLPGAVVLCADTNQQGACSCRDDCMFKKNCCPEVCSSEFCSLSLNIANMCHWLSKQITVPQVFQTCPVGNGPSDSTCSKRGLCSTSTGTCHCFSGYLPPDCSVRNYECPHNCYGDQGVCINGNCSCFAGYRGRGCRSRSCPYDEANGACNGNGTCNSMLGRCKCNAGWYGYRCNKRTVTRKIDEKDDASRHSSQQINIAKRGFHSYSRAIAIPDWPMPVLTPQPESREQAVVIFNEIIDFPVFNFTKDIWNDIATNLSQKINMPRNNVFLVHLSKYQEPAHDASQQYILPDPCLKNKSCSIGQLTFDSSQQGKTSIGIAVLTNVENIYSILGTIREYAMEKMKHQLNVTARLNGKLEILSFNNGNPKPSRGTIAFLSVVALFVFVFSLYISAYALRNELREEKNAKKVWLTLPAATEDSHAILLEELILTGTKIDWLGSETGDQTQCPHNDSFHTQNNSTTTSTTTSTLRRRPSSQITMTRQ